MNFSNQKNRISSTRTSEKKNMLKSTSSRTNEKFFSVVKKDALHNSQQ
ncbi:hypothetical protein [uncultured Flavobacterium sp.]|nr:hypothetical protein [uncultured Flavobacterium sp.]